MFDFLPLWARPVARVGLVCFCIAMVLFSSVVLLAIAFPQWVTPSSAIVLALLVAGGIATIATGLSILVIGAKIIDEG